MDLHKAAGLEPYKLYISAVLKIWKNVYSIDGGPLQRYEDLCIDDLMKGKIPISLRRKGITSLEFEFHRDEHFQITEGADTVTNSSGDESPYTCLSEEPETMELTPSQLRMSTSPALKISKKAPFFDGTAVFNRQFVNISINDFKDEYPILFFYPFDFAFVCPTEIIAFSERIADFDMIGCKIVGCSTDSQYSHLAWMNIDRANGGIGNLTYPLLSDKSTSIARSYGVLDEDTGLSFRGLFIIDPNQYVRHITINDLPVGRSVDETLRLVQAIQYTDTTGEMCPVNWEPGKRTIVPNSIYVKKY